MNEAIRPMRPWIFIAAAVTVILLAGCGEKHEKPNFTFMPDMAYTDIVDAQDPNGGYRVPPEGTVPRGKIPYPYTDAAEAGRKLKNPLTRTKKNFLKGKEAYGTFCVVCHGPRGLGKGTVVPKFPIPPSLVSDKLRNFPDGRIFHIPTKGQVRMGSYAAQTTVEERWAIVLYIRALQRAAKPTASDFKRMEAWKNGQ